MPNGVLAARRTGLFCVAIPNLLTSQLFLEHADMRLQALSELPLGQLLSRFSASSNGKRLVLDA